MIKIFVWCILVPDSGDNFVNETLDWITKIDKHYKNPLLVDFAIY